MEIFCDKCSKNCCSKYFKGLFESAKDADLKDFVQIMLSQEDVDRLYNAGLDDFIDEISVGRGGGGVNRYFLKLKEDNFGKAYKDGK